MFLRLLRLVTLLAILKCAVQQQGATISSQVAAKSSSSQQKSSLLSNIQDVIYYPNWEQYKSKFNLTFSSTAEESYRKKVYLTNVMFYIEDTFQKFPDVYRINNKSHISYKEINANYANVEPIFQDLVGRYNRTYGSPEEKAYREKVFNDNMLMLPALTNYSDLTPDEFDRLYLPANLVVDANKSKQLVQYKIYILRNQTKEGFVWEKTKKIMNVNLVNATQSFIQQFTQNQNNGPNLPPWFKTPPKSTPTPTSPPTSSKTPSPKPQPEPKPQTPSQPTRPQSNRPKVQPSAPLQPVTIPRAPKSVNVTDLFRNQIQQTNPLKGLTNFLNAFRSQEYVFKPNSTSAANQSRSYPISSPSTGSSQGSSFGSASSAPQPLQLRPINQPVQRYTTISKPYVRNSSPSPMMLMPVPQQARRMSGSPSSGNST